MEESLVIKYTAGSGFSVTLIAKEIDAATISAILRAVQERDYSYVKRLKASFNFECIVIDNGTEHLF